MASKNIEKDKELKEVIDQKITSISVVNNTKFKPFIELFENYPENILHKPLGILLGFFKINDNSEDSSYIVNFLTSILKKEYYANHKRSVSDSFDSALKKVNLALSELAKQGNINWIGNLNAAICVIEKNNFHFAVSGTSKILLLRNEMLSEISKDLASDLAEPNPMKTFIDVSSGKLIAKDKLIVSSDDLFNLFTTAQIKKSALRFSNDKFAQFIRTALINELKMAGTILIDILEPKAEAQTKPLRIKRQREDNLNVFSEKTFRQANRINIKDVPLINKSALNQRDYIDQKTGHIYIQGEEKSIKPENESWQKFREFLAEIWFKLKENLKASASRKFKKIKNGMISRKKDFPEGSQATTIQPKTLKPNQKIEILQEEAKPKEKKSMAINFERFQESAHLASDTLTKIPEIIKITFIKIIPDFKKIGNIFINLSRSQKFSALAILLAIIFVPLIYIKFSKETPRSPEEPVKAIEQTTENVLAGEKNLQSIASGNLISGENLKEIVILKGKSFAIGNGKIISLDDQKQYSFSASDIKFVSPMDDLNLIFLFDSNNKILSFSPISSEFKENNISIPSNSNIKGISTFLTYLYLIDEKNNQIYRYPRADGGFGNSTNWLKDNINLSQIKDVAIDENVYLLENNQIIKLFKGKKENLSFESTQTETQLRSIYTNEDIQNIYALDSKNGRIIKYAKTGEILNQYYNDQLKDSLQLVVDESNSKSYIISKDNNILSFQLN